MASPSRERAGACRNERARIERLVGEINGTYGLVGHPALHYIHRPLEPLEVAALYRAADVMLVTPIQDGMNLVAKEFVASRIANRGVLVLSEFAGASFELTDALLVNPHDVDAMKQHITMALAMPSGEVTGRMTRLRSVVEGHTVHDWADEFLARLLDTAPPRVPGDLMPLEAPR